MQFNKEQFTLEKSYKMNSSCADAILLAGFRWQASKLGLLSENKENYEITTSNKFGLMFSWDGGELILMILKGMLKQNSLTTQPRAAQFILLLLDV